MKKRILFLFIALPTTFFAQEKSCEERATSLLVEKIKTYKSTDLIPYYSEKDDKWGLFHKITKKKVTEPVLHDSYFFTPNLNFYYSLSTSSNDYEDGCHGKITGSNEGYAIISTETSPRTLEMMQAPYNQEKISNKHRVKENVAGFEVDANGNVSNFNPKFYDATQDNHVLFNVFNFQNKYYAVAKKVTNGKTYFSIINQQGEAFPHLENLEFFPDRKQIYSKDKDVWFLIQPAENQYNFVSLLKGKKLKETFNESYNWRHNQQNFAYAIMKTNDEFGLLDLVSMKWKIKPSKKNDFGYLKFSCSEPLAINYEKDEFSYRENIVIPTEMILENRKKAFIYIENDNRNYYDLKLNLYKPID